MSLTFNLLFHESTLILVYLTRTFAVEANAFGACRQYKCKQNKYHIAVISSSADIPM